MSEIVKKIVAKWDEISGAKITDDHYLTKFFAVGKYDKIRGLFDRSGTHVFTLVKTIQGNFSYKHKPDKASSTVVSCGIAMFDSYWTSELLDLVGETTRVELWHMVKLEKQENTFDQEIDAMVLVNARGDCAIIANEIIDPNEELEMIDDLGNKMMIKQEPPKILAKVEESMTNTFDPFSF